MHSGKFDLGGHTRDEPLKRITELNEKYQQPLLTPMMGQVDLDDERQEFERWWEKGI